MRIRRATVLPLPLAIVSILGAGTLPKAAEARAPAIEDSPTTLTLSAHGRKVAVDKAPGACG